MINMRLLDAWLGLVKLFPCGIFMFVWPPFMAGTITWIATEIVTFTLRGLLYNTRGTGVGERQGNQIFQNVRAAFQMVLLISSSLHIDSRTTPDGRVDHLKVTCGFWKNPICTRCRQGESHRTFRVLKRVKKIDPGIDMCYHLFALVSGAHEPNETLFRAHLDQQNTLWHLDKTRKIVKMSIDMYNVDASSERYAKWAAVEQVYDDLPPGRRWLRSHR